MRGATVTSLGHAGLRVEAPGVRVLLDPWLSSTGAFLGSWFPFPDNAHLRTQAVLDADVVVVSHEHLDHFDLELLRTLPPEVPIVVPRYPSTVMERRLRGIGRRHVVALEAWQRYPLGTGGDWLTVIPEQCPMSHDAAVLLHVGGQAILHTNDARISLAQARRAELEAGRRIDLMGVQMSGASWHPLCYDYDSAERRRLSTIKRVSKFKAITRLVRQVRPGLVLPYAGPPCFLDGELFEFNPGLHGPDVLPDQDEALAWLRERLPDQPSDYLLPGDAVHLGEARIARDPQWAGFRLATGRTERRRYLEQYAERRADAIRQVWAENPVPDDQLGERFRRHFASLGQLSGYFLARIGMVVRFDVLGAGGGVWDVHLDTDGVEVDLAGGAGEAGYSVRLDSRWLAAVVDGRARWEELLLSLRFTMRRNPDRYNDYLIGLLKHADRAALLAVEEYETARDLGETFEVTHRGRSHRVSRYCPHAGEDLREAAVVEDGVLRCLAHNFEFDLATGACLNARSAPLVVAEA